MPATPPKIPFESISESSFIPPQVNSKDDRKLEDSTQGNHQDINIYHKISCADGEATKKIGESDQKIIHKNLSHQAKNPFSR